MADDTIDQEATASAILRHLIQRGVVVPCTDSKGNRALQSGAIVTLNPDEAALVAGLFKEGG